jgi:hypothetical protein
MFIYGIYFISKPRNESFISSDCPNTMIKDGNKILLYNPKYPKVPGVNPIQLESLEDYEEYVEWLRANKLNCPILHLEKVFNTQGESQYQVKDSFETNGTGGLNHELPKMKEQMQINDQINDSFFFGQNRGPEFSTLLNIKDNLYFAFLKYKWTI